jgi:predicted TPR repeat methyltransferase
MLDLVDDLYQQGLKLHGSGKVELAYQVYTLVLNAHPEHSMANHSLGVLSVDIGKVQEALPFFEAALEANADVAQFWVSYIDALINLERIADAQAVFGQAKSNGAKGEGFDKLERRLTDARGEPLTANSTGLEEKQPKHSNILDGLKLDQALSLARKKARGGDTGEAKRIYQDILAKFPKNKRARDGLKGLSSGPVGKESKVQDPPHEQLQALINLYSQGQLKQALDQANILLQKFPSSSVLYNICGAVYKDLGQFDASIEAFSRALTIQPDYADAYNNKGLVLKDQGKLEEAIKAYNKALAIKPDHADAYYNMGNALQEQGKLEEAIEAYNKALTIKPDYAGAYNNMGNALQEQGKLEEAIEAYNKALAIKPDEVELQYIVASLTGKTTTSAPKKYIENLFDEYSKTFEQSLVGKLEYKTPKLLADIIVKERGSGSLGSVLDLGCGTGLMGVEIKDYCSNLEGIDLSKKMLALADAKKVYDKLIHTDILDYLADTDLCFDYFIATDVLVYVGDLTELFRLIKSRNKRKGKLVFSTEKNVTAGFQLETSGRYSHAKSYIEGLCKKFDYSIAYYAETDLRKEKGAFLTGGLYVLNF